MKKILIIGIKGMAGHVIFDYFNSLADYDVFGIARNIKSNQYLYNLDVTNLDALNSIVVENKFDVIINCIGILNKDAEDNPEKAIWFNSYFPHYLEQITKNTNTKLIHISTDCVFSGKKGHYTEENTKDGEGFYAQSKALGEVVNEKDTTIRTSIIGPELNTNGIGLFHWFMSQPSDASLNGYYKAFWTGLTTLELAKVIHAIINQKITGLIQVVPQDKINKFELLRLFNSIYRNNSLSILKGEKYAVDKSLLSIRKDFDYKVPTYEQMLIEQKKWISDHSHLYNHYSL